MARLLGWCLTLVFVAAPLASVQAQSRLTGDTFTFSAGNFPDSFGTTYDPVVVPRGIDFFDLGSLESDGDEWGGEPVEMTFDGIAEQAGGLIVNERTFDWPGRPGGIFVEQAAGVDGVTELDLFDWELEGEVVEFSFRTADGEWLANDPDDQSFYSIIGLDWANSDPGQEPFFFETGFYFYYSKDGVPVSGYETQLPEIGLLVGQHPFDESVEEVVYIGYSRGQVEETTKPYEGGVHVTGGTTQLDENDASWAALLEVMGVAPDGHNGLNIGFLVEPPGGDPLALLPGDTDLNGVIDGADMDLLSQAVNDGLTEGRFDINGDGQVDAMDRTAWVKDVNATWFGDSNLDREFNSGDLVEVFTAGKYDTGQAAGWAEGDWDGNGTFDSGDLVAAFTDGGYELGPPAAAQAVPEPASLSAWLLAGLTLLAMRRRR